MEPPPAPPLPLPPDERDGARSPWLLYATVLIVPLALVAAALTGALGPAFRLDGTVDHVTVVLVDARVDGAAAADGNGSAQGEMVAVNWCQPASLEGDRLLWYGPNYDTRASVVVLIRYTSTTHPWWFGSGSLAALVRPGQEYAVRPAMMASPALYRVQADEVVTLHPGFANQTAADRFDASYTVHGLEAWGRPQGDNFNTTVTESHAFVVGYGVPVVERPGALCE